METVALALVIDWAVGDPPRLWRATGHPVTWFGAAIAGLDRLANRGGMRRAKGVLALGAALAAFVGAAFLLTAALAALPGIAPTLAEAALGSTLLAHRSLHEHVARVAKAGDLADRRREVRRIVGRDVDGLDDHGLARAGLETLGESLSDGVLAPAFWLAVGGLPGLVAYKVVNTADSMIGHRTARHEAFGWAAARLDDLLNIVPARLTAALVVVCAPRSASRAASIACEANRHVSPNAGWPEAAFAHALSVSLGGPRSYAGRRIEGAWFNRDGRAPEIGDVGRALALSRRVGVVHVAGYAALALV